MFCFFIYQHSLSTPVKAVRAGNIKGNDHSPSETRHYARPHSVTLSHNPYRNENRCNDYASPHTLAPKQQCSTSYVSLITFYDQLRPRRLLLSYAASACEVCQTLDSIIICRLTSGPTLSHWGHESKMWDIVWVLRQEGVHYKSDSLLDVISFYRHHNDPE